MYRRKKCELDDIWVIRDFLIKTKHDLGEKVNWIIDRLNFTYSVSRIMNEVSEEAYRSRITMYYEAEDLVAVLMTEGENRGEAFIAVSSLELDDTLIKMVFDDLDIMGKSLKQDIHLRISTRLESLSKEAIKRGYELEDWSEVTTKLELKEAFDDSLPEGYTYGQASSRGSGLCHAKAFGYYDRSELHPLIEAGLDKMKVMDDYDPELDIVVLHNDQPVAFATVWYDDLNKLGQLEPVGTHPDHRKMGLAKKAIYRGCNLIRQRGAELMYVGSDQEFYKRIGFKYASEDKVYKKSIK
ncbi:GNAT family N-acetyltransferase [Acidaminobacter sp. JC074]|uniref:GNAT family N-acetyltransferase n=1 Tax=Acidaminobacter sp. JC074 TaxID=2530199 RepID=UPI001F0F54E0|nr:GNAT family N-acetyltransferase [Acidaminobacter sp. JC074]MCH4890607.1 GNAT family N-acetyltransferase [Acidaminobacter sp. JC074]